MMSTFSWLFSRLIGSRSVSREVAAKIMGATFLSDEVVGNLWMYNPGKSSNEVCYSESTLERCRKENEKGELWRLVYDTGLSVYDQQMKMGFGKWTERPTFYDMPTEDGKIPQWLSQPVPYGYYLLNFKQRFFGSDWEKQEKQISKLGRSYLRAPETVVSEAVISLFMATGERMLQKTLHWGSFQTEDGLHPRVGYFDRSGLLIYCCPADLPRKDMGVVLCLKRGI